MIDDEKENARLTHRGQPRLLHFIRPLKRLAAADKF
jgi:hypothetical protein